MTEQGPKSDSLEAVLDEFANAWLEGRKEDPDDFCKSHPEFGPELRSRIDDFLLVTKRFYGAPRNGQISQLETRQEKDFSGMTIGDFNILREIGRGGMGVVYEAEQISLHRTVALKVLTAHLTLRPESIKRFKREASAAARLHHPGIVKIHTVGEDTSYHFFAMEFVEGAPLNKIIEQLRQDPEKCGVRQVEAAVSAALHRKTSGDSPPTCFSHQGKSFVEIACDLIAQVAEALDHAHQSGIIHRDVKPSNILVCEDGTAVLTDFGLAREEGLPSITRTGDFAGTPYYISPEQAKGEREKVDHRSDVYSLGVTLYELLTLKRPIEGKTTQEVLFRIDSEEPVRPKKWNCSIPTDLETVVLKALEKIPEERYQNAAAFVQDLHAVCANEPIQAQPASLLTKISRFIRRKKRIAAALVVSLLMVAFFLFVWPRETNNQPEFVWTPLSSTFTSFESKSVSRQEGSGLIEFREPGKSILRLSFHSSLALDLHGLALLHAAVPNPRSALSSQFGITVLINDWIMLRGFLPGNKEPKRRDSFIISKYIKKGRNVVEIRLENGIRGERYLLKEVAVFNRGSRRYSGYFYDTSISRQQKKGNATLFVELGAIQGDMEEVSHRACNVLEEHEGVVEIKISEPGSLTASFTIPDNTIFKGELFLRHMSAVKAGALLDGVSPISININGKDAVSYYDPGSHAHFIDAFSVTRFLRTGKNTISIATRDGESTYLLNFLTFKWNVGE